MPDHDQAVPGSATLISASVAPVCSYDLAFCPLEPSSFAASSGDKRHLSPHLLGFNACFQRRVAGFLAFLSRRYSFLCWPS